MRSYRLTPQSIFEEGGWKWTPRAVKVISTAGAIASPAQGITGNDLLLALESVAQVYGDNVASRALTHVGIRPSTALGRPAPESCPPNRDVSTAELAASLSGVFPALAIEEARSVGNDYVGIEHLLLFLARIGVPGVDLPYARIRETIHKLMGRG
jgi:hypothetical protein